MDFIDWHKQARDGVNQQLVESYFDSDIGGWCENYITTRVLKALAKVGTEFAWDDAQQNVCWKGYKLRGKQETVCGDIAIFVRVQLLSDRFVDGVVYYEAKRQYFGEKAKVEGFKSVKEEQLARILNATHASHVLLYDVDPEEKRGYAASVPTILMHELVKGKFVSTGARTVARYGSSWIRFLGDNFKGFGLDYSDSAVQAIEALSAAGDGPLFILNAAVGRRGQVLVPNPGLACLQNYDLVHGCLEDVPLDIAQPEVPGIKGPGSGA